MRLLGERNRKLALSITDRACRTFDDYTADARVLDDARRALLKALG